ncbi:hypothetical protein SS50377_21595 [Spironucleus salmonicida]|uniref:Uncharacterized protein n=1 Tax=Spironucleus salmonicida TaxID=348837 RepID=V6LN62_9EUKA|nr:hypothetical protein SS50377_21595 [Spironucleus salmonicida]|eukprot:EST46142.1 Hypothetical protein SS50377_13859 [Spironucleus salmonicida]
MLVLLAVEIPDCYSGATVQYNQNLETATVMLVSNNQDACQQFLDEVRLSLIFHDGFHPTHFTYDSYNYSDSNRIVMQNVEILNDDPEPAMPLYARLNISNLAFWTGVRVAYVGNQVSQMDQCFDQVRSNFSIIQRSFSFTVGVTNACLEEISTGAFQFLYQFNEKADTIAIRRREDFPDDYNCETIVEDDKVYLRCKQEGDFIIDLQTPFMEATVEFTIQASGINYASEINFDTVFVGTVVGLLQNMQVQFFKDLFYIEITFNTNTTLHDAWVNLVQGSNLFIYRLTVQTPIQSFTFQFNYPDFDFNHIILTESCYADLSCLNTMSAINKYADSSNFYMDITGFQDITLKGTVGMEFKARTACFRRMVMEVTTATTLCIELEKSAYFNLGAHCLLIKDDTMSVAVANGINSSNHNQRIFNQEVKFQFSFKNPRFCFEVSANKAYEIASMRSDEVFLMIQLTQGNNTVRLVGSQVGENNYSLMLIITCLVGGTIVIVSLIDSVWRMVIFVKVSKTYKRK